MCARFDWQDQKRSENNPSVGVFFQLMWQYYIWINYSAAKIKIRICFTPLEFWLSNIHQSTRLAKFYFKMFLTSIYLTFTGCELPLLHCLLHQIGSKFKLSTRWILFQAQIYCRSCCLFFIPFNSTRCTSTET